MKNSLGGTIQVFVLARPDRPQERDQPEQAERDGRRDEVHEHVHDALLRVRAFKVTRIDDDDMATAAMSGVTKPAIAKGTKSAL